MRERRFSEKGAHSRINRIGAIFLTLSMAVWCWSPAVFAQTPTGSIEGVVTDTVGAVVPGAKITVSDTSRGRTYNTTSSSKGSYFVTALPPADYQVKIEAANFKTEILSLKVEIGKAADGNVRLQVGAISETVSVTANSETSVDVNRATVEGIINAKQIDTLPINGRNFLDLAQLEPGVQTVDGGFFDPTKNGFVGVSIAGGEGRTTRIAIDGIDVTDETVGTTVQNYSMDALQEFQISSFSLDPSTSLSNTGAIAGTTRSGSNQFHGSGFIFWRDDRFAARTGDESAPFNREQGGGRIGGPILKDKLFFFLNFEKNRTESSQILAPPAPFTSLGGFAAAPFSEKEGTARLDWTATDKIHVFGRFTHDDNAAITGFGGSSLSPFANQDNTNTTVAGVDVSLSHFTHSFRYGHVNFANYINPASLSGVPNLPVFIAFDDTGVTLGPNFLAPQHTLQTNNEFRYDGGYIRGNHSLRFGVDYNRISVNLFAAFFGNAPLLDTLSTNLAPGGNPSNPLDYIPIDAIFGNGLGFFSNQSNHGYQFGGVHNNRFAAYVSDSWKVRRDLTANFGVRYEYDPGQVNDDLTRPAILDTVAPGESRQVHLPKKDFAPTLGLAWDVGGKGNWVIRAGAGLYYETNIFNNVIFERAGLLPNTIAPAFPVVFDAPGFNILTGPTGAAIFNFHSIANESIGTGLSSIVAAQNTFQAQSLAATASFPNGAISLLGGGGLPGTQNTAGPLFASEFSQPYSLQMNIGIQKKFGKNWLIQADYVRNRGVHTFLTQDYNRVGAANTLNIPTAKAAINATLAQFNSNSISGAINNGATISDFVGNGLGRGAAFPGNNPNFGNLTLISTEGLSVYQGLLVKVVGRTGEFHHFLKSASWQVSYALTRFNATQGDQAFAQAAINNNCVTCLYGPNGFDRTHQVTINTNFEFPWDFHFNTITHWNSALPVTLRVPNSGAGSGEIFFSDLTGSGTASSVLPGTNLGAYGRSVSGVSALNNLITQFNQNFAGKLTPAGQALVNAGLFTTGQLEALGAVIQPISLAPAGQVSPDAFWATDVRLTKIFKIKESVQIEPSMDIFNLFNKANYDPPGNVISGFLSGAASTLNGTLPGQRTNKYGLGAGSFSPGIPRAFQLGVRVTF